MQAVWTAIEPHVIQALIAVITAGVPCLVAWLRTRTQREAALAAAFEIERTHQLTPMESDDKLSRAVAIASKKLEQQVMRPNGKKLAQLIEQQLPKAREMASSVPPDPAKQR